LKKPPEMTLNSDGGSWKNADHLELFLSLVLDLRAQLCKERQYSTSTCRPKAGLPEGRFRVMHKHPMLRVA